MLSQNEHIMQEAREAYAKLFDHLLSRSHVAAIAALYGWSVLVEDEACSVELL